MEEPQDAVVRLLSETKTSYIDAHSYVAHQRKDEIIRLVKEQIEKKKAEEAKISWAKKACGLLGKLVMGGIVLAIVSPMLMNLY